MGANFRKESEEIKRELDSAVNEAEKKQHDKVSPLCDEFTSLKSELESIRETFYKAENDHAKNVDDIAFLRKDIVKDKQETERMVRERDTLKEKLSLKMLRNEETAKSLQDRKDKQFIELEDKKENIRCFERTILSLQSDLDKCNEESDKLKEERRSLNDAKKVSGKIDELYATIAKVQKKFSMMKEINLERERKFNQTVAEREQKILEIAELEEQIRASTKEEHHNLTTELLEQESGLKKIVELVDW